MMQTGTDLREYLEDPLHHLLLDYWLRIRGDKVVPDRADFDPLEIRAALPWVSIYKMDEAGDFNCALAGEAIQTAWGRSIIGRLGKEILGDLYPRVKERWQFLLSRPAISFARDESTNLQKPVERLILPLAGQSGSPDQLLLVSIYRYPDERTRSMPANVTALRGMVYFDAVSETRLTEDNLPV